MTKKQMQARIAELEAMVLTLSTAINAMRTPIYVSPIPAQPTVYPQPYTQPYTPFTPYVGDPPYPWGPTTVGTATGVVDTLGGLQSQCNRGHQEG